jgi:hypothetical protein
MANKRSPKKRRPAPKTVLRLPDLDQAKSAVLNSLSSDDAQRGYRHAMDEFIEWYCSEPRLSFSRTVVVRYRMHLESRKLAPGTVNLGPGAVRRLAYEASDCGLLSPDLAANVHTNGLENFWSLLKRGINGTYVSVEPYHLFLTWTNKFTDSTIAQKRTPSGSSAQSPKSLGVG